MIVTATEVTILTNISASAGTIISSGKIPNIQARINRLTNNYFTTDLYLQGAMNFNGSALTISGPSSFEQEGFLQVYSNWDIYIYNSYVNDGYQTIASINSNIITLVSGSTIYEELSGRSVMINLVKYPIELKEIAAEMIYYDMEIRNLKKADIKSFHLGPFGESYGGDVDETYGYPKKIVDRLIPYTIARVM